MTAPLARLATGSSSETVAAEIVILDLCRVLLGEPKRDKHGKRKDYGLMNHIVNGEQHIRSCQIGMYIEAGDSLRGGQPCSDRCQRVRDAIDMAEIWLKAHEHGESVTAPRPPTLFDAIEEAS